MIRDNSAPSKSKITSKLAPNPTEAIQFLGTLFQFHDQATFRPVETWEENGRKHSKVFWKHSCTGLAWNSDERIKSLFALAEEEPANLFYGVCPRWSGGGKFEMAHQIRFARCVWADVDNATVKDVRGRIDKAGLPRPSIVNESGNGVHVYWLLDGVGFKVEDVPAPLPVQTEIDDKKRRRKHIVCKGEKFYLDQYRDLCKLSPQQIHFQNVLSGVAQLIGGDHTQDLSRLLRLPGSLNRKDARNGKPPTMCRMVQCESDLRYPFSDFEKFAKIHPEVEREEKIKKVPLPPRKKLTPAREEKLQSLLIQCATADVGQRSHHDMALCCEAIRQGTDKEVVWSMAQGIGKFEERGRNYFDLTWNNATENVQRERFEKYGTRTPKKKAAASPPANGEATNGHQATYTQAEPPAAGTVGEDAAATDAGDDGEAISPIDMRVLLAVAELRKQGGRLPADGEYLVLGGVSCFMKSVDGGREPTPLGNHSAWITSETTRDDGAETHKYFTLEGENYLGHKLPEITISAAEFHEPQKWITKHWGASAIINHDKKTRVCQAIQSISMSRGIKFKNVYSHTGWREINGQQVYLHAGGGIAPDGHVDVPVELCEQLKRYILPPSPFGGELAEAVKASLEICWLMQTPNVTLPLFASIWRAPLGIADYSVWVVGRTGSQKSELGALVQQHFGPSMTRQNLPGSWESTSNSTNELLFLASDALVTIDDSVPRGTRTDIERHYGAVDRILRGVGNGSARRMRADGSLRPVKPPRCFVVSTGEDVPRGASLQARLLILEMPPNSVDLKLLTLRQADAKSGLYAQAMSGYLRWLSPRLTNIKNDWEANISRIREKLLTSGNWNHARQPSIVADLTHCFEVFLQFALESSAITSKEAGNYRQHLADALTASCESQHDLQQDADPAQRFVRLLLSCLSSGRAHLADKDGTRPDDAEKWGWQCTGSVIPTWIPQGRRIGWVSQGIVMLDPPSAYAAVQELANSQGDGFGWSLRTLSKRLDEAKILYSDPSRDRTKSRVTIERQRREVFLIPIAKLGQ